MSAPPGDVVDRLERLAAHAPGGVIDPDAVWTHGRRRHRVRLGAALAALVAVGLLGTTTTPLLVERAQRVEPADSDDKMVLPDVVRQPGAWEPAFPSAPGRLSAVAIGTRGGLLSDHTAAWGVSATTGESRFLDLPDAVFDDEAEPVLSADGRRLAYWIAGDISGESLRSTAGIDYDDVVGVAVMDLTSGEVQRWEIKATNGLSVRGFAWAGDTLWWRAGDLTSLGEGGTGSHSRTRTWDLSTGEQEVLSDDAPGARLELDEHGPAPDGFVVLDSDSRMGRVASDGSVTAVSLTPPRARSAQGTLHDLVVNENGNQVAALLSWDGTWDGTPQPVVAGPLDASGGRLDRLTVKHRVKALVGWRSVDQIVAVMGGRHLYDGRRTDRLWVVDPSNGSGYELVELHGTVPGSFAADALAGEVVPAPDAPFAPDPRLLGLGLLAAAFVGWRIAVRVRSRRVRA